MLKLLLHSFISMYALIKSFLGIPPGMISKKSFPIGFIIQGTLVSLAIIILLLLYVIALLIQIVLWGIDLYLICKWGKSYGGRLRKHDVQFDVTDEKLPIVAMAVLNHSDDQEVAVERVKNELMKFHGSSHKLSSTVRRCLGYPYYVKKHTKAEDCVEVIKVNNNKTLSKDDLMDYIQKNYSKDVINGDKLWYGRIFAQPVSWNKKSEKHKQMVIMWVFRHCLADGISLIALVQKVLYRQNALENPKVDIKVPKPSLSLDDVHMNRNPFTCEQDEDTFNTEKGERQIAINSEDEINYVPLVKKIKSKLGVGFTEVLTACLTASLAEVLAKRGKTMDKYTMGLLFRPYDDDFVKIINGTYDYNNLSNNFTAFIIRVPVTMKQGSTMIDRIKAMDLEAKKAKTSVDALFNHTLTKYGHYIPHPIMKSTTMFMMRMSAVASNVGAMRDGTIAGYEVESGLSYLPYCYDTAFRFAIVTKGDRFQLALTTKEGVLKNRKECQIVLDGVFKYIDQLNKEIEKQS